MLITYTPDTPELLPRTRLEDDRLEAMTNTMGCSSNTSQSGSNYSYPGATKLLAWWRRIRSE